MSAEVLRQAANKMQEDNRHDAATGDVICATLVAVAAWLYDEADWAETDLAISRALDVAVAYLGESE